MANENRATGIWLAKAHLWLGGLFAKTKSSQQPASLLTPQEKTALLQAWTAAAASKPLPRPLLSLQTASTPPVLTKAQEAEVLDANS